jgi:peptidoglycan-associated lipoprotein
LEYLVDLGVAQSRLRPVSFGKEKPVDPGSNEAAWARNRRAHFVVAGG